MYEDFAARVDGHSVELSLFFPDNTVDPSQYEGDGDLGRIYHQAA